MFENRSDGRTALARWRSIALHAGVWAILYVSVVVLVRRFHPTLTVNALATLVLLSSYAAAIYLDRHALAALRATRGPWVYLAGLIATEAVLTVIAVASVQGVYALFWHPDPRQFGFWMNFVTDFLGMNVFVASAACIAWAFRAKWRRGAVDP
jgi:hypothetical protein